MSRAGSAIKNTITEEDNFLFLSIIMMVFGSYQFLKKYYILLLLFTDLEKGQIAVTVSSNPHGKHLSLFP